MNNEGLIINGELHNDLCVGIDLGTTNSVLSIVIPRPNGNLVSKVIDIPRAVDMYSTLTSEPKLTTARKATLPSCVYYREENNYKPLIGDFAKKQYPLRPHLVAKSIKSQMGKEKAEGLSDGIPDKTPAEIASRILEHLLRNAEKVCNCKNITDAIITVPANFDSAMCRATIDAAQKAGVTVKNKDGSDRPVLLSEPNAVIYDLINQIHNGEIPSNVLDLSVPKRVLVFDLGGGTLDITIHEIKRRADHTDALKVEELATNRYTLLGGDNFDEKIAETMYERFLRQHTSYPDVCQKIKKEKKSIMSTLRVMAENLKIDINASDSDSIDLNWGDDENEVGSYDVGGGNIGGCGYSYDDVFTKKDVEEILKPFFAYHLSLSDYKNIQTIKDTNNIIYPILDVLDKAHKKRDTEDLNIDAVIMNGGMSKFYMVVDRLRDFFGFDPIVALDPDMSVARGAAIYHHYLHKYDSLQEDMRIINQSSSEQYNTAIGTETNRNKLESQSLRIEWGKNILNDCLYLGLRNGNVQEIIPTGAELPYKSKIMTGFQLQPGQNMVAVPIKSKNLDGSYRTISTGNIVFEKRYPQGIFVAFTVTMESSKVIHMTAWTTKEQNGEKPIEKGEVEILIGAYTKTSNKARVIAPSGSALNPKTEINNIIQLCKNQETGQGRIKSESIRRLKIALSGISTCVNRDEFAPVILDALQSQSLGNEAKLRLIILARKIGESWDSTVKTQIAAICMNEIKLELNGWARSGPAISICIQCIYALSVFGNTEQINQLQAIHDKSRFFQACLYVHGKTKTQIEWIYKQFEQDVKNAENGHGNNLQFSVYAIGMAMRKDGSCTKTGIDDNSIIELLCDLIRNSGYNSGEYIVPCIIALGLIADTRYEGSQLTSRNIQDVKHVLYSISDYCKWLAADKYEKSRDIALKMINGESLSEDEERYLLTKLEQEK